MSRFARDGDGLVLLYVGWFLVDFDLAVLNPLLVPAAGSLHVSLSAVTLALTAYLLFFGVLQPVHGIVSDAVGRVRVLRVALLGWGLANLVAGLAPNVGLLVAGRAAAGAFAAAMIPVTAAYVGDRVPPERRQRTMANLMAVSAVGAAAATLTAGVLTDLADNWRPTILLVAVVAVGLAYAYGALPEEFQPPERRVSVPDRVRTATADRWLRFLIAFTFVEGAAMVGFYNFFNASVQVRGSGILVTGAVTSSYGIAAIAGGLVVGAVHARAPATVMFGAGTAVLVAGYVVAALAQNIATILVASVCAGFALAVAQSTVQTWVLTVAPPQARGTATSLVACAVFTGAAASTAAVGGLAGAGDFGLLFGIAAAVSLLVAVVGVLALARFARTHQPA